MCHRFWLCKVGAGAWGVINLRRDMEMIIQGEMLMYGKGSKQPKTRDRPPALHYLNQRPKIGIVGKSKLLTFSTMPTTAELSHSLYLSSVYIEFVFSKCHNVPIQIIMLELVTCAILCRWGSEMKQNLSHYRLNGFWKSTGFRFTGKINRKCVHSWWCVPKMIISGRENMSATPSAGSSSPLYLRYKLTADAARHTFDNGLSVVIQDNYYGDELNRMINYLHKYPVEVAVLSRCGNNKRKERYQEKTGLALALVENLIRHLCRHRLLVDNSTKHHSRQQKPFWTPESRYGMNTYKGNF